MSSGLTADDSGVPNLEPFYRHKSGRVFETLEAAQEFVERQAAFLAVLASGCPPGARQHRSEDAATLELQRSLVSLRSELTSPAKELPTRLNEFFGAPAKAVNRLVTLGSAESGFFESVVERHGPAEGFAALALKAKVQIPVSQALAVAAANVVLFDRGLDEDNTRAHEERARETVSRLEAELQRTGSQNAAAQRKLADLHGEFAATAASLEGNLETLTQEARSLVTKTVEELEALVATKTELYSTKLALQAPLTYWKRRRESQKGTWRLAGGGFLALIIASFLLGWYHLDWVRYLLNPGPGSHLPFSLHGLLALALILTIPFWLLRILARLFFSAYHLYTDAEERHVLIETYLALLDQGHVPVEKQDPLLLNLFRSANSAIVGDDSAPPSTWEFITRLLTGGK